MLTDLNPELLPLIGGLIILLAFCTGYLVSRLSNLRTEKELALSIQQVETLTTASRGLAEQAESRDQELGQLKAAIASKEQALSSIEASFRAEQQRTSERTQEIQRLQSHLEEKATQSTELHKEIAELRTRQAEREEHFRKQLEQFQEQKDSLKQEFENLANKIFESKTKVFTEKNKTSIDDLLSPFKIQLKDFKEGVEKIHLEDTKQQSELKTELKQLKELNVQITQEAHDLATALKGQKKMQGNWGEMILENVLDRSGLVKDRDYRREVSITDDDGRSRPDAIVYLPDEKHLIIDAKVSLNAYTRYVNADDELEREQAAAEHISAIADRIKELSDRHYYNLPGLNSPEMVFMFIPIESAFVEAMKKDESVFQKALEMNVLVATPTTLLTSLNIVRQLWRFEDQNKHTAELSEKAGKVYDKLRTFVASLDNLGRALERAQSSYDAAYGQLVSGKGNLIKQANEFKQLGVSVKAELPEHIVEKAELELDRRLLDGEELDGEELDGEELASDQQDENAAGSEPG